MTFVSALGAIGITGTAATIGGAALSGAAIGAGLGGVSAGLTGGDVGEGMGMGALTGAISGGITSGIGTLAAPAASSAGGFGSEFANQTAQKAITPAMQSLATPAAATGAENLLGQAGTNWATTPAAATGADNLLGQAGTNWAATPAAATGADNLLGQVGTNWAATPAPATFAEKLGAYVNENPIKANAAISIPLSMALSPSGNTGEADVASANQEDRKRFLKYLGNYHPSLAPGYAAGGITDLDGYMSNAQNIPNPQEVADSEGYNRDAVQMLAHGGIADLGGYAAGGIPNLLHGPGDGVSDDIPASIAGKQPARLASGEYVVPSRIVSELGNGSTDAGAKRLDKMVRKVNAGRAKTLGGKKYATDTRAYKHLPA